MKKKKGKWMNQSLRCEVSHRTYESMRGKLEKLYQSVAPP